MLIIGIAGGTGSGKTTVVREILNRLAPGTAAVLPQDAYYRNHLKNYDHPDSIEWSLLIQHLQQLARGETVERPTYSYVTDQRLEKTVTVKPHPVVIIEGILVLSQPQLREMMDLKIFVDADSDDRLIRVISRDLKERGRTTEKTLERYQELVKPMHLQFIEPTKSYADLIIPQGGHNRIAIETLSCLLGGMGLTPKRN